MDDSFTKDLAAQMIDMSGCCGTKSDSDDNDTDNDEYTGGIVLELHMSGDEDWDADQESDENGESDNNEQSSEAESCMHPLSNHQSNPTADWNSDSLLLPSDPTQTCDNDIENRVSENITESETGDIGTTDHELESNLSDQVHNGTTDEDSPEELVEDSDDCPITADWTVDAFLLLPSVEIGMNGHEDNGRVGCTDGGPQEHAVHNEDGGPQEHAVHNEDGGLQENAIHNEDGGPQEHAVHNEDGGPLELAVHNEDGGLQELAVHNEDGGPQEHAVHNEDDGPLELAVHNKGGGPLEHAVHNEDEVSLQDSEAVLEHAFIPVECTKEEAPSKAAADHDAPDSDTIEEEFLFNLEDGGTTSQEDSTNEGYCSTTQGTRALFDDITYTDATDCDSENEHLVYDNDIHEQLEDNDVEPGEIEMDALESCDSADSEPDMAKTESFITPNTGILTNEDVCSSETLQASGFCNDVENLDCNIMINDNDRLYLQNDEHFQEANAVVLEENTIEETQPDPTDGSFEQSLEEEYVVQSENGVDWNTATMYLMADDAGETNDTVMFMADNSSETKEDPPLGYLDSACNSDNENILNALRGEDVSLTAACLDAEDMASPGGMGSLASPGRVAESISGMASPSLRGKALTQGPQDIIEDVASATGFEPLAIPLSDIGLNSSSSQLDLPGLSTALVPHERLPLDPPSNNNSEDEDLYMVIADSSGADGDDISTSEASDNDASENGDGDGDNEEEETFIFQVAYDNAVSDDNSQPGLTYDSDESSTEVPAIRKPTKKVQEVEKNEPEEICTVEPEISVVEEEEEEKVVENEIEEVIEYTIKDYAELIEVEHEIQKMQAKLIELTELNALAELDLRLGNTTHRLMMLNDKQTLSSYTYESLDSGSISKTQLDDEDLIDYYILQQMQHHVVPWYFYCDGYYHNYDGTFELSGAHGIGTFSCYNGQSCGHSDGPTMAPIIEIEQDTDDYESFPNTSTTDDVDPEPAIKSSSQSDLLECYKHLLTPDPTLNPGTTFSDADVHVSEVKPTYKQFQNFYTLLNTVEKQGLHRPGMVKIIPPEVWRSCKPDIYEDLDILIANPVTQHVSGRQGIYTHDTTPRPPMTTKQYQSLCKQPQFLQPKHIKNMDKLERRYWRQLRSSEAISGCPSLGSLVDKSQRYWNLQNLGGILDYLAPLDPTVERLTSPHLSFNMYPSTEAWHLEPMNLYSVSYLHYGASKTWYCVQAKDRAKFEKIVSDLYNTEEEICADFFAHRSVVLSPEIIAAHGVKVHKVTQDAGEFMLSFPGCYYMTFSHGASCSEHTNFATKRWLHYAAQGPQCDCGENPPMTFDLEPLLEHLHEEYKVEEGKREEKARKAEERAKLNVRSFPSAVMPSFGQKYAYVMKTGYLPTGRARKKKTRCGECAACKRDNCRECVYCLDMKKYGGPCVLKQRCIERRCTNPILPGMIKVPIPNAQPTATHLDEELSSIAPVPSPIEAPAPSFIEAPPVPKPRGRPRKKPTMWQAQDLDVWKPRDVSPVYSEEETPIDGVPHIYFCDTCERGYHEMHSLVNHYSKHPSHDPMGCVIPPGEAPESEDDGTGTQSRDYVCEHCYASYIGWRGLMRHFDRNPTHDARNLFTHQKMKQPYVPKYKRKDLRVSIRNDDVDVMSYDYEPLQPDLSIADDLGEFDLSLLGYDLDSKGLDLMADADEVDAPVTCSYCGMIYKAFKPKECTKCGKVFGAGRDRRRHTLGESRQPVVARCAAYTCSVCSKEFNHIGHYRKHLRRFHDMVSEVNVCDQSKALESADNTVDKAELNESMDTEGLTTSVNQLPNENSTVQTVSPVKDVASDNTGTTPTSKATSILTSPPAATDIKCKRCSETLENAAALRTHIIKHHPEVLCALRGGSRGRGRGRGRGMRRLRGFSRSSRGFGMRRGGGLLVRKVGMGGSPMKAVVMAGSHSVLRGRGVSLRGRGMSVRGRGSMGGGGFGHGSLSVSNVGFGLKSMNPLKPFKPLKALKPPRIVKAVFTCHVEQCKKIYDHAGYYKKHMEIHLQKKEIAADWFKTIDTKVAEMRKSYRDTVIAKRKLESPKVPNLVTSNDMFTFNETECVDKTLSLEQTLSCPFDDSEDSLEVIGKGSVVGDLQIVPTNENAPKLKSKYKCEKCAREFMFKSAFLVHCKEHLQTSTTVSKEEINNLLNSVLNTKGKNKKSKINGVKKPRVKKPKKYTESELNLLKQKALSVTCSIKLKRCDYVDLSKLNSKYLKRKAKLEKLAAENGGKVWECETCDDIFTTHTSFRVHMTSHMMLPSKVQTKPEKEVRSIERSPKVAKKKEPLHICKECGEAFFVSWHLENHMQEHYQKMCAKRRKRPSISTDDMHQPDDALPDKLTKLKDKRSKVKLKRKRKRNQSVRPEILDPEPELSCDSMPNEATDLEVPVATPSLWDSLGLIRKDEDSADSSPCKKRKLDASDSTVATLPSIGDDSESEMFMKTFRNNFVCKTCTKSFSHYNEILTHCKTAHGKSHKAFSCTCGMAFKDKWHLKRHAIRCPVVQKGGGVHYQNKNKHIEPTRIAPVKPEKVVKKADVSTQLKVKKKLSSSKIKRLRAKNAHCPCGKIFKDNWYLKRHQQKCTPQARAEKALVQTSDVPADQIKSDELNEYVCDSETEKGIEKSANKDGRMLIEIKESEKSSTKVEQQKSNRVSEESSLEEIPEIPVDVPTAEEHAASNKTNSPRSSRVTKKPARFFDGGQNSKFVPVSKNLKNSTKNAGCFVEQSVIDAGLLTKGNSTNKNKSVASKTTELNPVKNLLSDKQVTISVAKLDDKTPMVHAKDKVLVKQTDVKSKRTIGKTHNKKKSSKNVHVNGVEDVAPVNPLNNVLKVVNEPSNANQILQSNSLDKKTVKPAEKKTPVKLKSVAPEDYVCKECGKRCIDDLQLMKHMSSHNRNRRRSLKS